MDLFPRTDRASDIKVDVSSHVETVYLLRRQKEDLISVPYEAKDAEKLKQRKQD